MSHNGHRNRKCDEIRKEQNVLSKHKYDHVKCEVKKQSVDVHEVFERKEGISIASDLGHFRCRIVEIPSHEKDQGFKKVSQEKDVLQIQINKGNLRGKNVPKKVFNVEFLPSTNRSHDNGRRLQSSSKCESIGSEKGFIENIFKRLGKPFEVFKAKPATLTISHKNDVCPLFPKVAMDFSIGNTTLVTPKVEANSPNTVARIYKNVQDIEHHLKEMQVKNCRQWNKLDGEYRNLKQLVNTKTQELCRASTSQSKKQRSQAQSKPLTSDGSDISVHSFTLESSTKDPTSYPIRGDQSKPILLESSVISGQLSVQDESRGTQMQTRSPTSEVTLTCSSSHSHQQENNWQPLSNNKEKKALDKLKQSSDGLGCQSPMSEDTVSCSSSDLHPQDSKNWQPLSNVKETKALHRLMRSSDGLDLKSLKSEDKLICLTNDSHPQENRQPSEDLLNHSSINSPPQNWEPLSNLKKKEALQVLINTSTTGGSIEKALKNRNGIVDKEVGSIQKVGSSELSLPTHILIARYEAEEQKDSEISVHNSREFINSDRPKTPCRRNGPKPKSAGENDIGISNELISTGLVSKPEKEGQCDCATPAKKLRCNYTETSRKEERNCKKQKCPNEYDELLCPNSIHDNTEIITNFAVSVPSFHSVLHGGNSQSSTENDSEPVNRRNKMTNDNIFSNNSNRDHESLLKSSINSSSGSCLFKNDLRNVFIREQNSNGTKYVKKSSADKSTSPIKTRDLESILKSKSNSSDSSSLSKNDLRNIFIRDKSGFLFNDDELPSYHSRMHIGKHGGNKVKQNTPANGVEKVNNNSRHKLVSRKYEREKSDEQSAYETKKHGHNDVAMHMHFGNETPFKRSKQPSVERRNAKHSVPKYSDRYKGFANRYSENISAKSQTSIIDPTSGSFMNVRDSTKFVQKTPRRTLNPKTRVKVHDIGKDKMVRYKYDNDSKEFENDLKNEHSIYGEHEPFRDIHQVEEQRKHESEISKKHKMDKKAMLRKDEVKRYLINYANTHPNENPVSRSVELDSQCGNNKEYNVMNNYENNVELCSADCHNLVQSVVLKTANRNVIGSEGVSQGHCILDPRKQVVSDSRHLKSNTNAVDKAIKPVKLNKNTMDTDLEEVNLKELTASESVGNKFSKHQIGNANSVKVGDGSNKGNYGKEQILNRKSIGACNSETSVGRQTQYFHGHEQVLNCSHLEDNALKRQALKSNSKDKDLKRVANEDLEIVNKVLKNKSSKHRVGNAKTVKVENFTAKGGKENDDEEALHQIMIKKSKSMDKCNSALCVACKVTKKLNKTNEVINFSKHTDEKVDRYLALKGNSNDKALERRENVNHLNKTVNNECNMHRVGNTSTVKVENCTAKGGKENNEEAALHQITMRKSKSMDKCNSGTCKACNQTKNCNTSNQLSTCPKDTDDEADRCPASKSKSKNKDLEKRVNENSDNAHKTVINKCSKHRLEHANAIQVQHCTCKAHCDEAALHQIKMRKSKSADKCNSGTCMACKQTENFRNTNEIINFSKHTDDKAGRYLALKSNSNNKDLERKVNEDLDNVNGTLNKKSSKHGLGNAKTIQAQQCTSKIGETNYDEAALHQIRMRKSKSTSKCNSDTCMACKQTKHFNEASQETNFSKSTNDKADRYVALKTGSKGKDLERRASEDVDNGNKTVKNKCSKHQLGNANSEKVEHRAAKRNYDQVALRQITMKATKSKETCNSGTCKHTKDFKNTNEMIKSSKHTDDKADRCLPLKSDSKNKDWVKRVNEDLDNAHNAVKVEHCTSKGAKDHCDEAPLHQIKMRKSKSADRCNSGTCLPCKQTKNFNNTNEVINFTKFADENANRCLALKSNSKNKDLETRVNVDVDNVNETVYKSRLGNADAMHVQHCTGKVDKAYYDKMGYPRVNSMSMGKCNSGMCIAGKQTKDCRNVNQGSNCSKHNEDKAGRYVALKTDSKNKGLERRVNEDVDNVNQTVKKKRSKHQAGNAYSLKVEHPKGNYDQVALHQITMKESKSNETCKACRHTKDFNNTNEVIKCTKHADDNADRCLASTSEAKNKSFEGGVNEDVDNEHKTVNEECSKHQFGNANIVKVEHSNAKSCKKNYDEVAQHQITTRTSKSMDKCSSGSCMVCNQTKNYNNANEMMTISNHTVDKADRYFALKSNSKNKELGRLVYEHLDTVNNDCSKHGVAYATTIQVQHSTGKANYGEVAYQESSLKSTSIAKCSSGTCMAGKQTKDFNKTNQEINCSKDTDVKEAGCLALKSKSKNKDLQRLVQVDQLPAHEKANDVFSKHHIGNDDTVKEHCPRKVSKRNHDEVVTVYEVRRGKSKSIDKSNSGMCIVSKQIKDLNISNEIKIGRKNSHGQAMRSLAFQSTLKNKDWQRRLNEDLDNRKETVNNKFDQHILGNATAVQVHYCSANVDKAHYDKATVYKIRKSKSADSCNSDKCKEAMKFNNQNDGLRCLNKTDKTIRYIAFKNNSMNKDLQRGSSEDLGYVHDRVNIECSEHGFGNTNAVKHCPCRECKGKNDEAAVAPTFASGKSKQLEPKCQLKGGILRSCKEDCNNIEGERICARPITVDRASRNTNTSVNSETNVEYVEELQCAIDLHNGSNMYRGFKGMTDTKRELCNRNVLSGVPVVPKVDPYVVYPNISINYPKGLNDFGAAVVQNSELVTRSFVGNESMIPRPCSGVSIDAELDSIEQDCEGHAFQDVGNPPKSGMNHSNAGCGHHLPPSVLHENGAKFAKPFPVDARQLYLETTDSKLILEVERRRKNAWKEEMVQNTKKKIVAEEMIPPRERHAVVPLLKSKRKYLTLYSFTDFLNPLKRIKKSTMKAKEAKQCKKIKMLKQDSVSQVDDSEDSDNSEVHSVIISGIKNLHAYKVMLSETTKGEKPANSDNINRCTDN